MSAHASKATAGAAPPDRPVANRHILVMLPPVGVICSTIGNNQSTSAVHAATIQHAPTGRSCCHQPGDDTKAGDRDEREQRDVCLNHERRQNDEQRNQAERASGDRRARHDDAQRRQNGHVRVPGAGQQAVEPSEKQANEDGECDSERTGCRG